MKTLLSITVGSLVSAAAVFLHLLLPPYGLMIAILGTFTSVWVVGRRFGKRRFKFIASISWVVIFSKAASAGTGGELLVQGDNLGSALMFLVLAGVMLSTRQLNWYQLPPR